MNEEGYVDPALLPECRAGSHGECPEVLLRDGAEGSLCLCACHDTPDDDPDHFIPRPH
jgi:hypothetical protein